MSDTFIEPLSAWLYTAEYQTSDGLPGYRVVPGVFTPERARAFHDWSAAATIMLTLGCGLGFVSFYNPATMLMDAAGWIAVAVAGYACFLRYLPRLFLVSTEIVMTTEQIGIRRKKRWLWFFRRGHRFSLKVHDRAVWEQRDNEAARQEASIDREVAHASYYYADSFHVVLELEGYRHDLLTVCGPRDAAAVLARLQYLDRLLDAAIQIGNKVSEEPQDEWHEAPGGLR